MKIQLHTTDIQPETRLDMKKEPNGTWSVFKDNTLIAADIQFDDHDLGLDHYKIITNDENSARVVRFADLHRHSDNSLKDGIIKVSDMVQHTEYAGALTDHGNLYGFLEYYKAMNAAGKHPIIGFEAYQADMNGDLNRRHLILLAKNNQGYQNLVKMASESYDHFYRVPHVTWDMLEQYHEGIICTSACLGGAIPKAILAQDMELARNIIRRFLDLFGDDFYLEIQRHQLKDEFVVNRQLLNLAKEFHIPVIATTDSHYLKKEDAYAQEITLCLQTGKTISEPHFHFEGTGYHLHTSEEMEELYQDIPEVLDNTLLLAEKCDVSIKLGDVNLPNYVIPDGFKTPLDYFKYLCNEGFKKRFAGKPELTDTRYLERFQYEMNTIEQMHFESYFIIVQDFINYAKSIDVYIGPGRGSAAGSLLAFCMGITDMNPIRFNLLFERFLNPERVSWPDIDTDIEHVGRQKVIDYITQKYGADNVCRIVTFGTMAAKMVIKDVSRVLEYPNSWANALAKLVPSDPKMTLKKAMEQNPELSNRYQTEADVKRVLDIAKVLEGCKRHASQHACGLVISPSKVSDFLPTSMEINTETGEKGLTSQVVMTEVEELSLLKMDLLGLKNMTAIHEVISTIAKTRGIRLKYQDIPLNDRATYQMLQRGLTGGVFQLESQGMTGIIAQMLSDADTLPEERIGECFERLIAAVALYRPGPMDYIPDYISGARNPNEVHYDCPEEESILSTTYGVLVYQEQLMQIAQKIAGYSLGEADILRKACGKKKKALMDKEHDKFISGNRALYETGKEKHLVPGCVGNGIDQKVAEEIWNKMVKFASYAFNRSHAACYAWIAYITAYMACHWTEEFFCAMLNAFEDINDKVKAYLSIATNRKISILPPDVNKSSSKCTVESGNIRLGFHILNQMNKYGQLIVKERDANGLFIDYQDFYDRMSDAGSAPSKSVTESLVFSGCLDCFHLNKHQLLSMTKTLADNYKKEAANRAMGQISLFSAAQQKVVPPDEEEFHKNTLMDEEYRAVGFYLTAHPVDELYKAAVNEESFATITELSGIRIATKNITTYGVLADIKMLFTKKNDEMYAFTASDRYSTIRCVLFPKNVAANKHRLSERAIVKIIGSLSIDEERGPQIIVNELLSVKDEAVNTTKSVTVSIHDKFEQTKLLDYAEKHPGDYSIRILANGHIYPIKRKIDLSISTLDFLQSQFSNVTF